MRLYLAIPSVVMALLIAASGVAAVTRGWVPPWLRSSVRRVRLYGLGQLVVAFGLCWYAASWTVFSDSEWGNGFGFPLMATGSILMVVSRNTGRNRQGTGMP
ncbi:hypothetical protein ACFYY3_30275 [Streptomyces sp. NPDC001812]|uniref:hypothetical protein n=1 Tax=Streptomyces sp. NPDC001812 TaxID=3364611 RepID=UPI0036CAE3D5